MRILYLTLAILFADQLTKVLVKGLYLPALGIVIEGMQYGQSIPVFGDWLKITYIENPHMAFGLDITGKLFLVLFSFAATIGMVLFLYKHRTGSLLLRLSLALIIAGALGNFVDRAFYGVLYGQAPLFYGNVVDFMDLDLFTIAFAGSSFKFWPIFNVADAAVSVGVVMLLITGIPHSEKKAAVVESASLDAAAPQADTSPSRSPGDGHA